MNVPQLVLLCLWFFSLGFALHDHGKPKKGTENVVSLVVSLAIHAAILWWGGFWSN